MKTILILIVAVICLAAAVNAMENVAGLKKRATSWKQYSSSGSASQSSAQRCPPDCDQHDRCKARLAWLRRSGQINEVSNSASDAAATTTKSEPLNDVASNEDSTRQKDSEEQQPTTEPSQNNNIDAALQIEAESCKPAEKEQTETESCKPAENNIDEQTETESSKPAENKIDEQTETESRKPAENQIDTALQTETGSCKCKARLASEDKSDAALTNNDEVVRVPTKDKTDSVSKEQMNEDQTVTKAVPEARSPIENTNVDKPDANIPTTAKSKADVNEKTNVGFFKQIGVWEITTIAAGSAAALIVTFVVVRKCTRRENGKRGHNIV